MGTRFNVSGGLPDLSETDSIGKRAEDHGIGAVAPAAESGGSNDSGTVFKMTPDGPRVVGQPTTRPLITFYATNVHFLLGPRRFFLATRHSPLATFGRFGCGEPRWDLHLLVQSLVARSCTQDGMNAGWRSPVVTRSVL